MNEIEARLVEARPELNATEQRVREARETRELLQDAARAAAVARINTPSTAADRTATQAQERLQQALASEQRQLEADEALRASIQHLEAEHADLAGVVGAEERAAGLQALKDRIAKAAPAFADLAMDSIALNDLLGRSPAFVEDIGRVVTDLTALNAYQLVIRGKERAKSILAGKEA